MMNVVAMALLLSYFGAVVVLVPESPVEFVPVIRPDVIQDGVHTRTDKSMGSGEAMDVFGMHDGTSDVIQEKAAQLKDSIKEKAERVKDTISATTSADTDGVGISSKVPSKEEVSASIESLKGKLEEAKRQGSWHMGGGGDTSRTNDKTMGRDIKYKDGSEGVREGIEGIKDVAQEGLDKIKDQVGVDDVQERASDVSLSRVKEKASAMHEGARDVVQDRIGTLKDKTSDVHERAQDAFQEGMRKAKEKASDLKEGAKEVLVQEGIPTLKGKAGDVKEAAMDTVQEGICKMGEKASDVKERAEVLAQEGMGKAKEKVSDVKEGAKDVLQEGIATVKEKASDVKEGTMDSVQEGIGKMGEKVSDVKERARDVAQEGMEKVKEKASDFKEGVKESTHAIKDVGGDGEGHKNKLWDLFGKAKEGFRGSKGEHRKDDGLVVRVHELCTWVQRGEDESVPPLRRVVEMDYTTTKLDLGALQESYAHLMKSAMASIARSREVFEKAVEVNGGGDWKENYMYLAESAEGALKAAEEMFERAVGKLTKLGNVGNVGMGNASGSETSFIARFGQAIYAKLTPLLSTLYLGIFSATYGMAMWMTFLSGHILSRVLPHQHLSSSLEHLSSVYLWLATCGLMSCAGIHAYMHPWLGSSQSERWQYVNFVVSLIGSVINTLLIEPKMCKLINEKLKLEKEEGRGQLSATELDETTRSQFMIMDTKLKSLHRVASGLNLVVLGGLMWHLWYLANRFVL